MTLPIEKRLQLVGDVSNLMLMGSIQVYGAKKIRVRLTMPKAAQKRAA